MGVFLDELLPDIVLCVLHVKSCQGLRLITMNDNIGYAMLNSNPTMLPFSIIDNRLTFDKDT